MKPAKLEIALQATRNRLLASISLLRPLQMVPHLAALPITGGQSHKRRLNHHLQSKNKRKFVSSHLKLLELDDIILCVGNALGDIKEIF